MAAEGNLKQQKIIKKYSLIGNVVNVRKNKTYTQNADLKDFALNAVENWLNHRIGVESIVMLVRKNSNFIIAIVATKTY